MAHDLTVMYSKKTDNWKTPTDLYETFIKIGCIDTFKYEADYNELEKDYYNEKLFVNPPFSKMKQVSKWIKRQYNNGNEIYLLIPARTDTEYFHDLMELIPYIIFIKGRLHYNDSLSAPFPTILMIFQKSLLRFPLWDNKTQEQLKEFLRK